jgi:hypothetical protein
LLLATTFGACSSLVTADRSKIPDELFDVPKSDAGTKPTTPDKPVQDAGAEDAGL